MYRVLGVLWAAISIVLLVREGLELGPLAGPFAAILSYYEFVMAFLFSPFEPYAERVGVWLFGWFSLELKLGSHWKYVYTLISLYVGAQALHAWRAGNRGFSLYRISVGLIIGFVGAASIGVLPLDAIYSSLLTPLLLGLTFAAYQLCNSFWISVFWRGRDLGSFWPGFRFSYWYPAWFVLLGLAAIVVTHLLNLTAFRGVVMSEAALSMLVFALLFVCYWYFLGVYHALRSKTPDSFVVRFRNEGPAVLATLMMQAMVGAALFLAANAGWSLIQ